MPVPSSASMSHVLILGMSLMLMLDIATYMIVIIYCNILKAKCNMHVKPYWSSYLKELHSVNKNTKGIGCYRGPFRSRAQVL